jgi:mRNA interferase MazF
MNEIDVKHGQIWLVNWSHGRSSEQLGKRQALVIQTNAANSNPRYPNTIVLTISTKGLPVAIHVEIKPDNLNNVNETSWVKCEQVLTVSKERLELCLGSISRNEMLKVEASVKLALGM